MSTRDDLKNEVTALDSELAGFAKKLKTTLRRATTLAQEDAIPVEFVGVVRSYRYAAGKKGEMPEHRFELECGQGLWLFVSCPSSQFDRFMKDMDMEGQQVGKALNGNVILVGRDTNVNALIPKAFYGEALTKDANGRLLWKGAKVRYGDVSGTVSSYDGDGRVMIDGVDGYPDGYVAYNYDVVRVD